MNYLIFLFFSGTSDKKTFVPDDWRIIRYYSRLSTTKRGGFHEVNVAFSTQPPRDNLICINF